MFEPEGGTSIAVLDAAAESGVPVYEVCEVVLHTVFDTPKLLLPEIQLPPYTYMYALALPPFVSTTAEFAGVDNPGLSVPNESASVESEIWHVDTLTPLTLPKLTKGMIPLGG